MNSNLEHLDIIDLLSERHLQLRRICEENWNRNNEIYISNSEWFIMARIYRKQPTISHVTKHVDISRQATHKLIRNLEAKGLVEISSLAHNKKDKTIRLTELGELCYEKNEQQKAKLEHAISAAIGADTLETLKRILKTDWGISTLDTRILNGK